MENIRSTGEMPSEFHKGVYDIAAQYANKHVGSYELDVNFGYSVSTKQVMDYYEKYKDKFQGGAVTPKGVHKNWEAYVKPVEASNGLTKEEIKVIVDGTVPKILKSAIKSGNNIQLSDLEDIVEIEMGDLYAKHLLPTITKAKSEAAFKGLQGIQAKDYVAKKALEHLGKLGVPNTGLSSSKSKELDVKTPSDLDEIIKAPKQYGVGTLESAAKNLLGDEAGSKWFNGIKNSYTQVAKGKLDSTFIELAAESLKYYAIKHKNN